LRRANTCASDNPSHLTSAGCRQFLDSSERARMQWRLETEFANFEKQF
jgi:hypothetical protein